MLFNVRTVEHSYQHFIASHFLPFQTGISLETSQRAHSPDLQIAVRQQHYVVGIITLCSVRDKFKQAHYTLDIWPSTCMNPDHMVEHNNLFVLSLSQTAVLSLSAERLYNHSH